MKKYIMIFAAMLATAAGCVREIEEPAGEQGLTFTASLGSETKVTVDYDGKVFWKNGDEIIISDGARQSCVQLSDEDISDDDKSASFTLTGLEPASKYYAAHPYSSAWDLAPDEDGFVKLEYMYYGSPGPDTYQTCCAVAGPDRSFQFKNAYCLLCIYDAPYAVEFRSDVDLYSYYCFNPETGEMKPMAGSETVKSFVTYRDEDGRLLIPLPSGITFPNGFQLYDISGGKPIFSTTDEFKTVRNNIYAIGEQKAIIVGKTNVVPAEGGSLEVDVQSKVDYMVTIEPSASGWIKYIRTKAYTKGKLQFEILPNETYMKRSGKVTLTDVNGKAAPVEFVITQDPIIKVYELGNIGTVSGEGEDFEVDIDMESGSEVEVSGDWLRYIGKKENRFRFSCNYNYCPERKATVTISDPDGKVNPVTFEVTQTESRFRQGLMKIYNAMDGPNWKYAEGWNTDIPINEWTGIQMTERNGETSAAIFFSQFELKGEFPDCFEDFADRLEMFKFSEMMAYEANNYVTPKWLKGTLPPSFAKCSKLKEFILAFSSMTSLPDVFYNMPDLKKADVEYNEYLTGPLPESLGNKDDMTRLAVFNNAFTGDIPPSWINKNFDVLRVDHNHLDGKYPDLGDQNFMWCARFEQEKGYGLDASGAPFKAYWLYDKTKDLISGQVIPFWDILKSNKYTLVVSWATWCPFSTELMPILLRFYKKYHSEGLEILANCNQWNDHTDAPDPVTTIREKGYDAWYNVDVEDMMEHVNESGCDIMFGELYTPYFSAILDPEGNVIFSGIYGVKDPVEHRFGYVAYYDLIPLLETLFGPLDDDGGYVSTDFSRDGEVTTIQTHTAGNGIDIVFMGDGYTDKDIASGDYDKLMAAAADEFFAIEPYKSFRNRFNVYSVKAVSKNGKVGPGTSTALSCAFGNGTYVEGDLDKCYEYALKVPGITSKENLLVSVLVNSNRGAGTAHYDISSQSAVAFSSSLGNDRDSFGHGIRHESGGHGFGFLDDEYVVSYSEAPQDYVNYHKDQWRLYGWWANVDFTNDPATIKWAKFLSDDRYKGETGIYAGGSTYGYGVWRPTDNSMMNENIEYFNAPSREAICKRIMTLSGEGYTWEKFVEYDAVNRTPAAGATGVRPPLKAAARRDWQPGAAPVVHK